MKNNNIIKITRNLIVFMVIALAVLLPGVATATGNAVVSVAAPVNPINEGEQFAINISVTPNNAIAGMQFNLSFDPAFVTANSVTEGNLLNHGGASTYFNAGQINNTAGTITGVFGAITIPGQTISTAGNFAVITMTAKAAEGACPLTLSNVVIGNTQSQTIPVNVTGVTVTITQSSGNSGGGGGGGGGGGDSDTDSGGPTLTNLLGSMNLGGRMIAGVTASDNGLKVALFIPNNTLVKDGTGQRLSGIIITPQTESQAANSGSTIIGHSYEIEPSGATFEASAFLIFTYSKFNVPADIPVNNLYIALWDPANMTWTDIGGNIDTGAGTITVPIHHLSIYALMAYNRVAGFTLTNFTVTPGAVRQGENITASVLVNNTSTIAGTYDANLKLDDVVVSTKTVTLNGGDSETVIFTLASNTVGEHVVSLGDIAASFVVKEPLTPAAFTVSELTVNPLSVDAGKSADISVLVGNSGDLSGDYQVTLVVDNIARETKTVTLGGGSSTTVNFSFTADTTGQHNINIGGLGATLEVKSPLLLLLTATPDESSLKLNSFSAAPSYEPTTNTLVDVRIEYEMNQAWESFPDARLMMTVFRDSQFLEQVPLFTLSQLQADGQTGVFIYVPSSGWQTGEYSFRAELYNGDNLIQDTPLRTLTVTPKSTTAVVSWKTLIIIIGGALVLGIIIVVIVLYYKRNSLRDYLK